MSVTAEALIQNALAEIGAYSVGNTLSAADAQFALATLNRMLDQWNAEQLKVYNRTIVQYTMITGLGAQPFTIGPSGVFATVSQRPEKVIAANVILNTASPTNYVRQPLNIRDDDWWMGQRTPNIASSLPTDLYYSAKWPNGEIRMWPVPTVAYPLELELWGLLTQIPNLPFSISLPPGYENALMYSLAIYLAGPFRATLSPSTVKAAQMALAAIENMNSQPPSMSTRDSGIPLAQRNRGTYNYHTGQSSSGSGR